MIPRWSDNVMYTNFGSNGWNIRNNTNTNVMFMTNAGNVGIGTTGPTQALDIDGQIRIRGGAPGAGKVLTSNANGTATWENNGVPQGAIIMWSGTIANIPTGWALCNGNNGTPDLRDRFILGVPNASTDPGEVGGSHTVTIATANLPSHTHAFSATTGNQSQSHTHVVNITTSSDGAHTHGSGTLATGSAGAHNHEYNMSGTITFDASSGGSRPEARRANTNNQNTSTNGAHTHSISGSTGSAGAHTHTVSGNTGNESQNHTHNVSGTTGATGSGTALTVTPKYYKLAFIMKL